MKTKVAFILADTSNGNRRYIAITKQGFQVFETTVYDCGHGAKIAHDRLNAAGFEVSGAAWANKACQDFYRGKLTVFTY